MSGQPGPRGEGRGRRLTESLPVAAVPLGALSVRLAEELVPFELRGGGDVTLTSVELDHRAVAPGPKPGEGPLYCCLRGERADGHDYAGAARAAGAVAFLCERPLGEEAGGAPQLVVGEGAGRPAMALAACLVAGDPARRLATLGVTGTNGKTTTTHLLVSILAEAGYAARVVGTLSGARTTPESPELQRHLAAALAAGETSGRPAAVALEVTSHALVQHRVDGYVHDVAVFTNLSRDHLDYHKTMEAYFAAKATLFTPAHARRGVANADDAYGRRLLAEAGVPVEPFSLSEAVGLEVGPQGSRFELRGHPVSLSLLGALNVENALAAAAAARALGVDDAVVARGLSAAGPVPGRFEPVENALGLSVVVDYAHTPAGLSEACRALRGLLGEAGRLVLVFGAGGDRDQEKRPLMGRAAGEGADIAVVTTDNPRHEDPAAIIAEVAAGCTGPAELHLEPDRRRAISLGLALARPGDVVLVAGKGHETTQQVGDSFFDFDDRTVVGEESSRLAGAA